jgi:hypothetical protein
MNFQTLSEGDFIDLPDNMRMSKSFMQLKELVKSQGSFLSNSDSMDYINKTQPRSKLA